ncbi:MAG: HAMP domain-containing sensor histidine kinase [Planctomycetota bacterium]
MPTRLLCLWLVSLAIPLVLVGWLMADQLRQSKRLVRDQQKQLAGAELERISDAIESWYETLQSQLVSELPSRSSDDAEVFAALLRLRRHHPMIRDCLVVDRDGRITFPSKPAIKNTAAIARYQSLLGLVQSRPRANKSEKGHSVQSQSWLQEDGLQIVIWYPIAQERKIGLHLERVSWIDSISKQIERWQTEADQVTILDARGRQIKTIGSANNDFSPLEQQTSRRLPSPFRAWQLTAQKSPAPTSLLSSLISIIPLIGLACFLASLGIYSLTVTRNEMRLAKSQLSFAANVSHELRTPLTNIRLYADLGLMESSESEEISSYRQRVAERFTTIEQEAVRLSKLIRGVLELVRPQRDLPIQKALRDLDELIDQTIEPYRASLTDANIELAHSPRAEAMGHVDEALLELILGNLISNVIKYAAEGQSLQISSQLDNSTLVIDVVDQGPGVPLSKIKSIFKPFIRLDQSITSPSGTGIGLAIARSAARRHGGNVELLNSSSQRHSSGCHFQILIDCSSPQSGLTLTEQEKSNTRAS